MYKGDGNQFNEFMHVLVLMVLQGFDELKTLSVLFCLFVSDGLQNIV